jgi:ornithine cyclodeaminase
LSRSDVIDSLDPDVLRSDLRRAFEAYSQNREIPARRVGSELPTAGSAMVLVSGLAAGIQAYSVKVHAKFLEASPSIRGLVLLFDAEDGALLSTMDSTYLTAARTGMTGALATDVLARDDATTMAVVGAGTQGEFGLRHLARSRSLEGVSVYEASLERAVAFAERMTNELGVSVDVHETVQEAVADRRIVLTAT